MLRKSLRAKAIVRDSLRVLLHRLHFAFWLGALALSANTLLAANCKVVQPHPLTEAEKALLAADYPKAVTLYQSALTAHPNDVELTVGLVHALLHQQKVQEAADALKAPLTAAPHSAALISLRGEVELRQGMPWASARTAVEAGKLDPCYPRNYQLIADVERINSYYASSRVHIALAHRLDPLDPDIRAEWIHTLPLQQRITETEAYLATMTGNKKATHFWQLYLEELKKTASEPHNTCRMVSQGTTAEIPFIMLMESAYRMRAFGLEVKLNKRKARLQIDTGANGLLVSRSVAKQAGLKPLSQTEVYGIGDKERKDSYTAYADSIHIGNLEFQNCTVEVLDSRNVMGSDGLIGMDVFSQFLVTLDYPGHKLLLAPLPPRPYEDSISVPALKTSDTMTEDSNLAGELETTDEVTRSSSQKTNSAATQKTVAHQGRLRGPYDRYIAPEMKNYTPVYRAGHNLILPATLNNNRDKLNLFILDTGAWATTISPAAAREVTKVRADHYANVQGIEGKVARVYSADKITFRFAGLAQKAYDVTSFDTTLLSGSTGMEISGLLGATTLDQLTIHIDYRDGLVKFDYDPKRNVNYGF